MCVNQSTCCPYVTHVAAALIRCTSNSLFLGGTSHIIIGNSIGTHYSRNVFDFAANEYGINDMEYAVHVNRATFICIAIIPPNYLNINQHISVARTHSHAVLSVSWVASEGHCLFINTHIHPINLYSHLVAGGVAGVGIR